MPSSLSIAELTPELHLTWRQTDWLGFITMGVAPVARLVHPVHSTGIIEHFYTVRRNAYFHQLHRYTSPPPHTNTDSLSIRSIIADSVPLLLRSAVRNTNHNLEFPAHYSSLSELEGTMSNWALVLSFNDSNPFFPPALFAPLFFNLSNVSIFSQKTSIQ